MRILKSAWCLGPWLPHKPTAVAKYSIRDGLRWTLPSDCQPQLAHHVHRGLFNCGILVYSDIDRGDRLVPDVGPDIGDQVLRAKLRRGNRSWFVVDPCVQHR